jgi:signal transduction histidine kinase
MEGTESLTVELAIGAGAEAHRGLVLPLTDHLIGLAFTSAAPVTSVDVCQDERKAAGAPRFTGLGPAVAVPIGSGEGTRGILLLARAAGRTEFTESEIERLQDFAAQAAVVMELTERRRDAEQIALLEDRDRIARDLHDLAIQRLFATGMTLQSAGRFIEHPEASERVLRAVDDLDETIKIIRSTIFGLRSREGAAGAGLRARAVRAVGEAAQVLGFAPSLRLEGLLDTEVPKELAEHVVAVLSESLTNVARHAHASRVDVVLEADSSYLCLTVSDNGVGIPAEGRRSGLRNMAERAREAGGELETSGPPGGGTTLVWRVPRVPVSHDR